MNSSPAGLNEAVLRFQDAARELLAVYGARKPSASSQTPPPQLASAFEQFLTITTTIDHEEGHTGPIQRDDVTQLGDHGLTLLTDMIAWAGQLALGNVRVELEKIAVTVADWVVRHDGEIRTLEPIVNALAATANGLREPSDLEKMTHLMTRMIDACAKVITQDLDKNNPARPWRVLHINRAICATRSHNAALMERVFDELIEQFPEEVAHFFEQGMEQMDALGYPPHVRAVMSRYHAAWTEHKMH